MTNWQTLIEGLSIQDAAQGGVQGGVLDSVDHLSIEVSRAIYAHLEEGEEDRVRLLSPFGELTYFAHHSGLHEPVLARNQSFVLTVAGAVINSKGQIDEAGLASMIAALKRYAYCIEPLSYYESHARQHVLVILEQLRQQDSPILVALLGFTPPTNNRLAEQRVRETLGLSSRALVSVRDARVAVLSMVLSYFRQNVGSCFATAPGIVLQRSCPELLIKDMQALFDRGRLERYFAGEGLEVPLSQSVGVGDYKRSFQVTSEFKQLLLRRFSRSPALDEALLAAGLLADRSREQRAQQVVFWLMPPLGKYIADHSGPAGGVQPVTVSIEQLVRWVALHAFGVKEDELKRYRERPGPMVHNGILIQNPLIDNDRGPVCDACLVAMETMERVFKRFGENPLLKSWEYTVASLTDHQSAFTNTNLYHSLGMDPRQPHGIGRIVEQSIQILLDRYNEEVVAGKHDFRRLAMQARTMQSRMHSVPADSRYTLELEFNKLQATMNEIEYATQQISRKTRYLSQMFNRLMHSYFDWFSDYFQEIYDPDLHSGSADSSNASQYDDAPAGFRLYFKNGRSDSSQWQAIHNEKEFLDALREFFRSSETLLLAQEPDEAQDVIRPLVTEVIQLTQELTFIEAAKQRLKASKFTSQGGDDVRTPWAYVSGGYVDKLLGAYFKLDGLPQTEKVPISGPDHLLMTLADMIRRLPAPTGRLEHRGFATERVLCSPTHAFVLQPYREPFRACWQRGVDPISWLNQHALSSSLSFFNRIQLSVEMQQYMLGQLARKGARLVAQGGAISSAPLPLQSFCQQLIYAVAKPMQKSLSDLLAALCYQQLPLFRWDEVVNVSFRIASHLGMGSNDWQAVVQSLLERIPHQPFVGGEMLQRIVLIAVMLLEGDIFSARDWQSDVAAAARDLGFAPPQPLLFADSNWFNYEFGFALNPVTGKLDIWQCDGLGHNAKPWNIAWGKEWLFFMG